MSTEYTPQPGTIAHRVLAYLRTLPPDAMRSSAVIADELAFTGDIAPYMVPAFEHGLVTREKRDGRWWWGVGHPQLRTLGSPPAVIADEDELDDAPMARRTVPASKPTGVSLVDVPAWSPPIVKESAVDKPVAPPQPSQKPKKALNPAPAFDPLKIEIKTGRPIPPRMRGQGAVSPYRVLLDRLKPGESVDLPKAAAKSLMGVAKKAGVKIECRQLDGETTGVWRL